MATLDSNLKIGAPAARFVRFRKAFGGLQGSKRRTLISNVRIALANIRVPTTPDDSVRLATSAVADAGRLGAAVICFPECFIPGYRWPARRHAARSRFPSARGAAVADAARLARVVVILGTERVTDRGLQITACVIDPDGAIAGWQDKGQIDPSEEGIYPALATERRLFSVGPLTFGVVICHEGWRYPETVRWAVRRGAQLVFHPHAHIARPGSYRPVTFADPANTFHEKAMLCRAAENTLLLRLGELCQRGLRHDVGGRSAGRYAAVLSAVRPGRPPRGGSGPQHCHGITRLTVPHLTDLARPGNGHI